jgi:hypothetical protein
LYAACEAVAVVVKVGLRALTSKVDADDAAAGGYPSVIVLLLFLPFSPRCVRERLARLKNPNGDVALL